MGIEQYAAWRLMMHANPGPAGKVGLQYWQLWPVTGQNQRTASVIARCQPSSSIAWLFDDHFVACDRSCRRSNCHPAVKQSRSGIMTATPSRVGQLKQATTEPRAWRNEGRR